MTREHLVPKLVIDKNGKRTTVMVNPFAAEKVPAPDLSRQMVFRAPPPPADAQRGDQVLHDKLHFGYHSWSLAPEGRSGAFCTNCRAWFSKEDIASGEWYGEFVCQNCGERNLIESLGVGIEYSSQRFIEPEAVRKEVWYHVTTNQNWESDIQSDRPPMVHLGTLESAAVRARYAHGFFRDDGAPTLYCFAAKVKSDAPIAELLKNDEREAPYYVDSESNGYEMEGVTRYVNRFEGIGNISLIANPQSFEVQEVIEWSPYWGEE